MSGFVDSHAHLTALDRKYSAKTFDEDEWQAVSGMLERASLVGVSHIVNICIDPPSLAKGLLLAEKFPWIKNVAATTPHDVDAEGELFFEPVKKAAEQGRLVGIGETGLDYYYTHSSRETQQKYLAKYLRLAASVALPVVIHCRDAFSDFFDILDREYAENGTHLPGVLHCFTGTVDEAKQVIDRGWYLSLSGIVTFKRSQELREVAKLVPLDQLLIETDTPYLAPQSHRGKRNEPSFLVETAQMIADCKEIDIEEVARSTRSNAFSLFNL